MIKEILLENTSNVKINDYNDYLKQWNKNIVIINEDKTLSIPRQDKRFLKERKQVKRILDFAILNGIVAISVAAINDGISTKNKPLSRRIVATAGLASLRNIVSPLFIKSGYINVPIVQIPDFTIDDYNIVKEKSREKLAQWEHALIDYTLHNNRGAKEIANNILSDAKKVNSWG